MRAGGVEVDDVRATGAMAERQAGPQVEVVRDRERHDRHTGGRTRPRERSVRMRRDGRVVAALRKLADEAHQLDLATAPAALRVHVQDPERA